MIEREFPFKKGFGFIAAFAHNQSAHIPQPRFGKFGIPFVQAVQNLFRIIDFFRKNQYFRFEQFCLKTISVGAQSFIRKRKGIRKIFAYVRIRRACI